MDLMREKRKVQLRMVSRDSLTPLVQSPSVYDLWDYMHITTCELITDQWDPDWTFCPICGSQRTESGHFYHRTRERLA